MNGVITHSFGIKDLTRMFPSPFFGGFEDRATQEIISRLQIDHHNLPSVVSSKLPGTEKTVVDSLSLGRKELW